MQAFGRREEDEIRSVSAKEKARDDEDEDSGVTSEQQQERRKVLDLLRKWQLGGDQTMSDLPQGDQEGSDDEDDDASIASSDTSIDVSQLPDNDEALLAMLTDEQRAIFLGAIDVSQGKQRSQGQAQAGSDRAKKLWDKIVEDEHRRNQRREAAEVEDSSTPLHTRRKAANLWWLLQDVARQPDSADFSGKVAALESAQNRPTTSTAGLGLAWNCACLLLAYTYTLLHLDIPSFTSLIEGDGGASYEHLASHSLRLLQRLAPFVLPMKTDSSESRLLIDSPSAASAYLLSKLGDTDRSQRPSALILELWTRAASLWISSKAVLVSDAARLPRSSKTSVALGDIWTLCQWGIANKHLLPVGVSKKTLQMASHKLVFLAAQVGRLAQTPATGGEGGATVQQQLVLGKDLESLLPSRDGQSSIAALSSAHNSADEDQAVVRTRRRREAETMADEILALRQEVMALEDEDRQQAAWRLMSGDVTPSIATAENRVNVSKEKSMRSQRPAIEVMEQDGDHEGPAAPAAPATDVPFADQGRDLHLQANAGTVEEAHSRASRGPAAASSTSPQPPAKASFTGLRKARAERSATVRFTPSKAADRGNEEREVARM